jgi:hypothetical protein
VKRLLLEKKRAASQWVFTDIQLNCHSDGFLEDGGVRAEEQFALPLKRLFQPCLPSSTLNFTTSEHPCGDGLDLLGKINSCVW